MLTMTLEKLLEVSNLEKLSRKFGESIETIKAGLESGSIMVYDSLDSLATFYYEADLPANECIKEDIKEGVIVYVGFIYYVWL
jgi:hypothetical protein